MGHWTCICRLGMHALIWTSLLLAIAGMAWFNKVLAVEPYTEEGVSLVHVYTVR